MKKNRRGFTLVELLAVLVILGIISVFALPTISRLVSNSRDKMYITDTKKFISIAEAKMKANSSDIDEPDNNKCIIMNLLYLDSNDLKHAPNGGEYLRENSFVIIKKNGDDLEYSATLVEKIKGGGYKGVKLIKRDVLSKTKEALKYVTSFKNDELVTSDKLTTNFINSQLGSEYVAGISSTYFFQDFSGSNGSTYHASDNSTPGFAVLNISSASHDSFNTVDSLLKVIVEDEDSTPSELTLSVSCEDKERGTKFCDDLSSIPMENSNAKQINIDFSKYGYTNASGGNIFVNVTIQDAQQNKKSKTLEYFLDRNKQPVVDFAKSYLRKRDIDKEAMTVATLKLEVTDDLDSHGDLKVCVVEDNDSESNCNYVSYNDYFQEDGKVDYQFLCGGNGCIRDGSTHKLKVYVKDSFNLVTSGEFSYTFSKNEAPIINNNDIKIISTEENYNSSKVNVKFVASDSSDDNNKLIVHLDSDNNHMEYLYSSADDNNSFPFDFKNIYDGSTKNLTVTVFDTEGLSISKTVSYQLYKNQKPTITKVEAVSNGSACGVDELCPLSIGGSKDLKLTLKAKDDLDEAYNMKMCVSDNSNYCANINNYTSYMEDVTLHLEGNYDGTVKTIYANIIDSYGLVDNDSTEYKLYKNQPPIIKDFKLESAKTETPEQGSLEIVISAVIDDDFDERGALTYSLKEDEGDIIPLNTDDVYLELEDGLEYKLGGTYDGSTHAVTLVVADQSDEVSTSTKTYDVYKDKAPEIDSFIINSDGLACNNPSLCPLTEEGNNGKITVEYEVVAHDDLDTNEDLEVCISETNECTDYRSYIDYYNANQAATSKMKWTFSAPDNDRPYDGSTKQLYVFVRDTSNYIVSDSKTYTIYNNQKPILKSEPAFTPIGVLPDGFYTVAFSDDLTEKNDLKIKYCYTVENSNDPAVCTDYYPYVEMFDIYGGTVGEVVDDEENNPIEDTGGNTGENSDDNDEKKDEEEEESGIFEKKNFIRLNTDNLFSGITNLQGQNLQIYSVIEDSYGLVTQSEAVSYPLYADRSPTIAITSAKILDKYYTDADNNRVLDVNEEELANYTYNIDLDIYYIASDEFDEYSACTVKRDIACCNSSNNSGNNQCSDCSSIQCDSEYSDWYNGSESESRHFYYTYSVAGDVDISGDLPLSLILKDKNNNYSSQTIKLKVSGSDNNPNICSTFDVSKNKYQFTPKSNNEVISADKCEGKCYNVNPLTKEINSLTATYNKTIFRFDRYSNNVLCRSSSVLEEMDCSFKDCFFKNNSYQRKAIGFYEVIDTVPWTYTELDKEGNIVTKVAYSHYQVYSSSYEEEDVEVYDDSTPLVERVGDEKITLTLTPEKICHSCINKEEYKYDSNSNNPIVRVNDFPYYSGDLDDEGD